MYLYLAADKFYNNKLISDQMAPGSSLHAYYCFFVVVVVAVVGFLFSVVRHATRQRGER